MTRRIDSGTQRTLTFRPNINYVEPKQKPGEITPVEIERPGLKDVNDRRDRIKKLAKAVRVLAAATQSRIDDKAKNVKIRLDPKADAAAIQALKRHFPNVRDNTPEEISEADVGNQTGEGFFITYDQYKQCREDIMKYGDETALKAVTTQDEIDAAQQELDEGKTTIGGVGTTDAFDGSLRPELDNRTQVVEKIDMISFQDLLIRILVNFIWKHFIKKHIPIPPGVSTILPDEIAPLPPEFKKQIQEVKDRGVQILV